MCFFSFSLSILSSKTLTNETDNIESLASLNLKCKKKLFLCISKYIFVPLHLNVHQDTVSILCLINFFSKIVNIRTFDSLRVL